MFSLWAQWLSIKCVLEEAVIIWPEERGLFKMIVKKICYIRGNKTKHFQVNCCQKRGRHSIKMMITESKWSISHDILSVVSLDLLYMSEVQDTL